MKLGKIFICINILVLSLLMLTEFIKILVTDLTNIIVLLFSILLQNDKSFAIGEKYIEIGRVTYAVAI